MKIPRKTIIGISIPLLVLVIGSFVLLPGFILELKNETSDYWKTKTPENVGMDSSFLDNATEYLENEDHEIYSFLIIRKGFIVAEWYGPYYNLDSLFKLYSATKSITSILIGIAIDKGYISSINDSMLSYFPDRIIANLSINKESITIEHLLTMTAGFDWPEWEVSYLDLNNIIHIWKASEDYVQFVLDRPMDSTPGEKFNYNTGVSHLLGAILEEATNLSVLSFANEYLFEPLQISSLYWEQDPHGIPLGGEGLYLKARDMAKIGFLFLNDGKWEAEQIISEEWVNSSITEHINATTESYYGYQWWISKNYDSYRASGFGGQQIHVFPEEELIIVFTGWDLYSGTSWDIIDNYILPSIIN